MPREETDSRRWMARWCTALPIALVSLGCARTRYFEYESVTADRAGTLWVAGSEGRLAFWDGAVWSERGYPLDAAAPDWSYEPSWGPEMSLPARVVLVDGVPLLFTRPGDVLRWDGRAWQPGWVRFSPASTWERRAQVNAVLPLPGGEVLVQLHSDRLLQGMPADFEHGTPAETTAPTYFTWLGLVRGELHGIGWDESGNVRALQRRVPSGEWEIVGRLGVEDAVGAPRCALAGADGRAFVVTARAIVEFAEPDAPPSASVLPVVRGPVAAASPIASDGQAPYVARCYPGADGTAALLVLGATSAGRTANVLVLRSGRFAAFHCEGFDHGDTVGAVIDEPGAGAAAEPGWRVVSKRARPYDEPDGGPARVLGITRAPGPTCRAVSGAPLTIAE